MSFFYARLSCRAIATPKVQQFSLPAFFVSSEFLKNGSEAQHLTTDATILMNHLPVKGGSWRRVTLLTMIGAIALRRHATAFIVKTTTTTTTSSPHCCRALATTVHYAVKSHTLSADEVRWTCDPSTRRESH